MIDATAQRWKPEDRRRAKMSDDASAGVALGSKHGFPMLGGAVGRRWEVVAR